MKLTQCISNLVYSPRSPKLTRLNSVVFLRKQSSYDAHACLRKFFMISSGLFVESRCLHFFKDRLVAAQSLQLFDKIVTPQLMMLSTVTSDRICRALEIDI
jgi:hypothetical protein